MPGMIGPVSEKLDAIIVGTGQAGKPLAGALAQAGWRTAIVERGRVGGTCIIEGCTPTKTMIASARIAHLARRSSDYGVRTGRVEVDLAAVRRRKREIVDSFSAASERGMRRHETLELILGEARFVGSHEVEVRLNQEGGTRRLTAEKIFINAGTRPSVPPIPGLGEVDFLDSTSVMELAEVPDHLIVLGGGFVGLEFAQMYRRFGAAVTVVEKAPSLAAREDDDVAEAITQILTEDGISLHTAAEVVRVSSAVGGVQVHIRGGEVERAIRGSHLLVAVGRTPNTDSLCVAAAGLEIDERGYLRVNDRLETSVPGVYALGDIAGSPPFTHIAYDDYRVIRVNILEGGDASTRDRLLPYTVFIDPQLGRVGLSERDAREQDRDVRIAKLPMASVARAIEVDETRGFIKAVVDARTDRILGAAMLGLEGGEVVAVIQAAMMGKLPYTALRDGIFAHPTLAESLNNLFTEMEG